MWFFLGFVITVVALLSFVWGIYRLGEHFREPSPDERPSWLGQIVQQTDVPLKPAPDNEASKPSNQPEGAVTAPASLPVTPNTARHTTQPRKPTESHNPSVEEFRSQRGSETRPVMPKIHPGVRQNISARATAQALAQHRSTIPGNAYSGLGSERGRECVIRTAKEALDVLASLSEAQINEAFGRIDRRMISNLAGGSVEPSMTDTGDVASSGQSPSASAKLGVFQSLELRLFHFTADPNVASIQSNGLISAKRLRDMEVRPRHLSSPTSRNLDVRLGLDNYVHLVFTQRATMAYVARQREPVDQAWFSVSPVVLDGNGTLFCRNYANKTGALWIPFSDITSLDLIALLIGFERIGYWQVMVPERIQPEYLAVI